MAAEASHPGPLDIRKSMEEWEKILVAKLGPVDDRIEETYHDIPLLDGHIIKGKVWRPKEQSSTPRPVILIFHGGGFGAGSAEMCTRPGREFALEFNAVVISATYRLAPEHKFPQAALDGVSVLEWVLDNSGREFGGSPEAGLVVGGYSAGAQIAAVIASEARSKNFVHPITGSFLCLPWLFAEETVPEKYKYLFKSREEHGEGVMGVESLRNIMSITEADPNSSQFCPLHSPEGLKGLPPTYVQVGGRDCVRDDGVIFEKLLKDAGVETKFDNHTELGHEAWLIFTEDDAPTSKALEDKTIDAMKWLLKNRYEDC